MTPINLINSKTCRSCTNDLPEIQEHLEICDGTKFERRGVRVSEVMGRVIFWRRMTQKMTQKTTTVTSLPEGHLPCAPSGEFSTTLGVSK